MRGRVLTFELLRVFEPKRGSISERTALLLIRLAARATCPYPLCPCGTFPPDRGNLPLKGKALGRAIHHRPAPREIPRRGRNPFLVGQRFAKGRSRPHKLHVPRPAASGRSRSLRCSSSPNCVRSAGTQFGSFPLAVFLYTTSGDFFRHAKERGAEPPSVAPRRVKTQNAPCIPHRMILFAF